MTQRESMQYDVVIVGAGPAGLSAAIRLKQLAGERIHRAEGLELYAIDRALVSALVARLDRRVAFSVSIAERELYVSIGTDNLTGRVERLSVAQS